MAEPQALFVVVVEVQGAADDHRHAGVFAQRADVCEPVEVGKEQVEQQQVRGDVEAEPECLLAGAGGYRDHIVAGEHGDQYLLERGVVLDDQHAWSGFTGVHGVVRVASSPVRPRGLVSQAVTSAGVGPGSVLLRITTGTSRVRPTS